MKKKVTYKAASVVARCSSQVASLAIAKGAVQHLLSNCAKSVRERAVLRLEKPFVNALSLKLVSQMHELQVAAMDVPSHTAAGLAEPQSNQLDTCCNFKLRRSARARSQDKSQSALIIQRPKLLSVLVPAQARAQVKPAQEKFISLVPHKQRVEELQDQLRRRNEVVSQPAVERTMLSKRSSIISSQRGKACRVVYNYLGEKIKENQTAAKKADHRVTCTKVEQPPAKSQNRAPTIRSSTIFKQSRAQAVQQRGIVGQMELAQGVTFSQK